MLWDDPRFMLITYQQLVNVGDLLAAHCARHKVFVFLDESHRIKSGVAKRTARAALALAHLPVGKGDTPQDVWKRVSPAGADPDKDKFQTFVAALADIRAMSFVDAKAKTGLEAPAATIVVKFDEGKKEDRVMLAKNGADAYSSRPDDPGAAKIDPTKLDEALKSIDEFTK